MRTLQDIEVLYERHRDVSHHGIPASDELIDRAEAFLGLRFPKDYRAFLKRWGTLSIGPVEIYGIPSDEHFASSSAPNAIWYTQLERSEADIPRHLIVLHDEDGDVLMCLDTADIDKSPVVVWDLTGGETWGQRAPSLFDYIADEVADIFE